MPRRKTVLITGCSAGGLGAALAKAFHEEDCHVFATARDPAKIESALAALPHVEVLALDVASPASVADCVAQVAAKTDKCLDVLINNAGGGFILPLLDTPMADAKDMFDVNFWGVLAMAQACAPLLINAKGTMVNVSSIAGVTPFPWQGIYNSSKAAVTMLSETLRLELEPLGVKVVAAMVGAVKTEIYNKQDFELPANSLYKPAEEAMRRQAHGRHQAPIEETADVTAPNIARDVLAGCRGKIWRGGMAGTISAATWLFPTSYLDGKLTKAGGFPELREIYKDGVPPQV
ncbi:putative short-chain dehydrogenase/reductase [Poronia punctata]|nr:putative short-chain dehydrogenase/reductase [Poronia punctata]